MKKIRKITAAVLAAICSTAVIVPYGASAAPIAPLYDIIETNGEAGTGRLYDKEERATEEDLDWLSRHLTAKAKNFSTYTRMTADLNLDGVVNVYDYILMKRDVESGSAREGISWEVSKVLYSPEFYEECSSDAILNSSEELREYINRLYMSQYAFYDIDESGNVPTDPYSDLFYEYTVKSNDQFFEDNILLVKPVCQPICMEILHDINRIYYDGDILNIDYTFNYDSLRTYETVVTPLLMEVTVPRSLYRAESVSWNYHEMDWELGVDEFSKGPITVVDNAFTYTSPDEKNALTVTQKVIMYSQEDIVLEIGFIINGQKVYTDVKFEPSHAPFNDKGDWVHVITTTGECILTSRFTDGKNYNIYWRDEDVRVEYTDNGKTYSYTFTYDGKPPLF